MSNSDVEIGSADPYVEISDEMTQEQRDAHTLAQMLQSRNQPRGVLTSRFYVESIDAEYVIRGLDEHEFQEVADMRHDKGDLRIIKAAARVVAYALVRPRMDAEFLASLGVNTIEDALIATLRPGEILKLSEKVSVLSGMSATSVEEVKN